jgi:hypothetical protein
MGESFPVYRVSRQMDRRTLERTIDLPREFKNARIVAERGLNGKPIITAQLLEALAAGIVSGSNHLYTIKRGEISSPSLRQVSEFYRQKVPASRFLNQLAQAEVVAGLASKGTNRRKSIFEFALWTFGGHREQPLPPGLYLPEEIAPIRSSPQTYRLFVEAFMLSSVVDNGNGYSIEHIMVEQTQIPVPIPIIK